MTAKKAGAASESAGASGPAPGTASAAGATRQAVQPAPEQWPLWEVFVRANRGLAHLHAGSLHAPDAELAVRNARDLYTRRNEGVSIWVVRSTDITASDPDERDAFFESPRGKEYRHASYYTESAEVPQL